MQMHGFIRDMMDVKVLILYVMAHADYPMDAQKTFELCYQDDKLSYFDVCEALPQLVSSGHLSEDENGFYTITEKGREDGGLIEDTVAAPVLRRALMAVEKFNRAKRRTDLVRTDILPRGNEEYSVVMSMDDEQGSLMTLEVLAPSLPQARRLAKAYQNNAEALYQKIMTFLIEQTESGK